MQRILNFFATSVCNMLCYVTPSGARHKLLGNGKQWRRKYGVEESEAGQEAD